ncbi:right-handed parallel beta-helix repeat-containing protein [Anaerosporobacter faecicola]|uniref:right-handed parallel beta-helix repeat-containing protein n=1 Tax=Anaerosporobacter faecicola TaxID=2718714 RepID=UPI00143AD182|nr:right-handed parallel beta-helix repeat-containing protein [Anaerosporobacter faecicola]
MDILEYLKKKNNGFDSDEIIHPFAYKDNTFKYNYCFGLGVLAYGNVKSMKELLDEYQKILTYIKLPSSYAGKIVEDMNNNFDYKINDVFEILDTKEKQYTFTSDLLRLSNYSLWSEEFAKEICRNYFAIFKFSKEEKDFFVRYNEAAFHKDTKKAVELYQQFIKDGYSISYNLLKYICKDILIEDTYDNLILNAGEKFIIDKPSRIHGQVAVTNGAVLILKNCEIKINGSIMVDGGRIVIDTVRMTVEDCNSDTLFHISNTAHADVNTLDLNCNFKCGAFVQNRGCLTINNAVITNTQLAPAIRFTGNSLILNGTTFADCMVGGIRVKELGRLEVDDCEFFHCMEEHGGAIYSNALSNSSITNSRFTNCSGKYLGGAIYFAYMKYGQRVYRCEYERCEPEDSIVFNACEEERP